MKILIMVLSYNEPPFKELMLTQQQTWAETLVKGVETLFYHGGYDGNGLISSCDFRVGVHNFGMGIIYQQIAYPCTDAYYFMSHKFKLALKSFSLNQYDYIFRTNSSSYVNKEKLMEFAATLPKEKLYAGWTFEDSNDFGGLCVSGAGIWLSRDTAEILRDQIDPDFEQEEDVYCGRILRRNGITALDDKSRFDVMALDDYTPLDRHHYRLKTGDRLKDIENMKQLHQKIINR